jgi:hypothetical protein
VPKINLAALKIRAKYRRSLEEDRKSTFDSLVAHLQAQSNDLNWYAELGRLVKELRGNEKQDSHGHDWFNILGEALGVGASLFLKANRFRGDYPSNTGAEFLKLKKLGITWTRLGLAFPIKDAGERYGFLVEAAENGWSDKEAAIKVQERTPSKRQGIGGRNRNALPKMKPEAVLRELRLRNRAWLEFHDQVWAKITKGRWNAFAQNWPANDREKLKSLLAEAANQVEGVVKESNGVQRTLEALLKKV